MFILTSSLPGFFSSARIHHYTLRTYVRMYLRISRNVGPPYGRYFCSPDKHYRTYIPFSLHNTHFVAPCTEYSIFPKRIIVNDSFSGYVPSELSRISIPRYRVPVYQIRRSKNVKMKTRFFGIFLHTLHYTRRVNVYAPIDSTLDVPGTRPELNHCRERP